MVILILCGCLEPGRDGVGDYSRKLAGELIRQGHKASLISINDRFLCETFFGEIEDESISIRCLRIPIKYSASQKINYCKKFIKEQNPDWISVQYVPFSFHPKGIHYDFVRILKKLRNLEKWHIMFHELWVGTNNNVNVKIKVYGYLQRLMIKNLLNKFKFALVTTSILKYQNRLNFKKNYLLPIFGNVICDSKINKEVDKKANSFMVVVFGTITNDLTIFSNQLIWLFKLALLRGLQMELIFLGNNGNNLIKAQKIASEIIESDKVTVVGFADDDTIASYFRAADYGLSRADYDYYGKSGSTISMLEFGLPVLLKGERPSDIISTQINNHLPQLYFVKDVFPIIKTRFQEQKGTVNIAKKYLELLKIN